MLLNFIIVIVSMLSAISTFYLSEHRKQGAVRASALLSLIVGILFSLFKSKIPVEYYSQIPIAFIGASFVGMVSSRALKHFRLVGFAGFIFGIIYINSSHFFKGYGGALGTSASISIMVTMCVPIYLSKRKRLNGLILMRKWIFRDNRKKRKTKS